MLDGKIGSEIYKNCKTLYPVKRVEVFKTEIYQLEIKNTFLFYFFVKSCIKSAQLLVIELYCDLSFMYCFLNLIIVLRGYLNHISTRHLWIIHFFTTTFASYFPVINSIISESGKDYLNIYLE